MQTLHFFAKAYYKIYNIKYFRIFQKIKYNCNFLWESFLVMIFPASLYCQKCGKKLKHFDDIFCHQCKREIPIFYDIYCKKCHKPLKDHRFKNCYFCHTHELLFHQSVSIGLFRNELKILIKALKYQRNKKAGKFLGKLLARKLSRFIIYAEVDYIVPVPLHPKKKRIRGYNQSKIIADSLLWHWPFAKKPLVLDLVHREIFTQTQTYFNFAERQQNMKNAFSCAYPELVKNKTILIIDDVLTTGATINECIKTIQPYGPQLVLAATAARA